MSSSERAKQTTAAARGRNLGSEKRKSKKVVLSGLFVEVLVYTYCIPLPGFIDIFSYIWLWSLILGPGFPATRRRQYAGTSVRPHLNSTGLRKPNCRLRPYTPFTIHLSLLSIYYIIVYFIGYVMMI